MNKRFQHHLSRLQPYFLLLLLVATGFVSCKTDSTQPVAVNKADCDTLKSHAQAAFDQKDYNATIELFEQYQECHPNQADFYFKLGLLHFKAGDLEASEAAFEKQMELRKEAGLSGNEYLMAQASFYYLLEKKDDLKEVVDDIDVQELKKEQLEIYEYYKLVAATGEFISVKAKLEFPLFDESKVAK